jgi:hypothetical protein
LSWSTGLLLQDHLNWEARSFFKAHLTSKLCFWKVKIHFYIAKSKWKCLSKGRQNFFKL